MKKLLFLSILIIFLTSGRCFAQFQKPVGVHQIPTYSFWKNNSDSTITIGMGTVDFYNTLLSKFDSVKTKGYATNFKLLSYKQIKDSTNRITGYATLWKLTHKLDSIVNLMKFRNDSVALSGYFTNYAALSKVDKITGYSLIRNTLRDSVITAEQHADTIRNQGHATIFDLKSDTATVGQHIRNYSNPHQVTKTQIGLSNVTNNAQVTSVTGSGVISSTGGTTPAISLVQDANNRLVTDTEKATWNGKQNALVNPLIKADTTTLVGTKYDLLQKIDISQKAANNGVATLDAGGKVPFTQLPAALMIYKGLWNPSTNTPTLSDATGTNGWVYKCSANGTANLGSGAISFLVGDFAIHNGTTWERSVGTDNVVSVNGQQGVVTLTTDNINEGATNKYYTDARSRGALSLTTTGSSGAATYNNSTGLFNIPTYTLAGLGGESPLTFSSGLSRTGNAVIADTSFVLKKTTAASMYQPKGNYEPAFTKNTGFNKNFGTTTGTVLEGRTFGTAANSATTDFLAYNGTAVNSSLLENHASSYFQTALTNPVTGTGTTNYIPKWTGSGTLGNSLIYDNGTNIGIWTTNPQFATLQVGQVPSFHPTINQAWVNDGTADLNTAYISSGKTSRHIGIATSGDYFYVGRDGSARDMAISSTGNVGIGTTNPNEKLEVVGNIRNSALTASKIVFTDASKNLSSTGIGTASQFIKGDGSLDGTTYLSSLPSHAHGNITNAGYLGTTATIPLITGTGGIIQAGAFGTTAGTFAAGDDSRINNGQTAFGWGNHASAGYKLASDSTNVRSGYTTLYQNSLKAAINHNHTGIYQPLATVLTNTTASFTSALETKLNGIAAGATNVTNTNQLINGAGFITGYTETDPTIYAWAKAVSKPSYAYSEITGTPTIPTVNDATLTLNTSGSGISGSQTFTANQGTAATFTVTSNATTANTASTIVLRDASGNVSLSGSFCSSSDSTLKKNIRSFSDKDYQNASKVDLKKFNFKADSTNLEHYGTLAQELEKLFPALVKTNETGKKEVNYTELLIVLIAQQRNEIEQLKNRIEFLEMKKEGYSFDEHTRKIEEIKQRFGK